MDGGIVVFDTFTFSWKDYMYILEQKLTSAAFCFVPEEEIM